MPSPMGSLHQRTRAPPSAPSLRHCPPPPAPQAWTPSPLTPDHPSLTAAPPLQDPNPVPWAMALYLRAISASRTPRVPPRPQPRAGPPWSPQCAPINSWSRSAVGRTSSLRQGCEPGPPLLQPTLSAHTPAPPALPERTHTHSRTLRSPSPRALACGGEWSSVPAGVGWRGGTMWALCLGRQAKCWEGDRGHRPGGHSAPSLLHPPPVLQPLARRPAASRAFPTIFPAHTPGTARPVPQSPALRGGALQRENGPRRSP